MCACTQLNMFQYMNETDVQVRQEGTGEKGRERCNVFQAKERLPSIKNSRTAGIDNGRLNESNVL